MTAKFLLYNTCLILLVWVYVEAANFDFTTRINEVLKNDTSLQFYAKCFLDKGPCSGDARAFKRLLPEFVSTSCGRCSRRQKQLSCKVIFTLQQKKYSDLWDDFLIKYDPKEQYRTNLTTYMDLCTTRYQIHLL